MQRGNLDDLLAFLAVGREHVCQSDIVAQGPGRANSVPVLAKIAKPTGGIRRNLFGGSRRKIAKKIANHRQS
jgi:hypothetical protein